LGITLTRNQISERTPNKRNNPFTFPRRPFRYKTLSPLLHNMPGHDIRNLLIGGICIDQNIFKVDLWSGASRAGNRISNENRILTTWL
jgi:hypothetical protein